MSRNEPRKASKNLTRKRETKKLIAKVKKVIKKVTGGAPGFYTALLANTGQEKDRFGNKRYADGLFQNIKKTIKKAFD